MYQVVIVCDCHSRVAISLYEARDIEASNKGIATSTRALLLVILVASEATRWTLFSLFVSSAVFN